MNQENELRPEVVHPSVLDPEHVLAGFTTRRGGVSTGRFAQLNFSRRWPEEGDAVARNLRLLGDSEGFDPEHLYTVDQVHGARGVCCDGLSPDQVRTQEADYLVCAEPGKVLGIITADCIPVLLWDPQAECVAAAHAGWRGLVAGVLEAAVADLTARYGASPGSLRAALGPAIGPCCFEVGPEVAAEFSARVLTVRLVSGRPHVDLHLDALQRLRSLGLREEHVEVVAECTCCNPDKYHSYRRDGARIGQHLSFVGLRP